MSTEQKPHLVDRSSNPHLSRVKRVPVAIRNKDEKEEMESVSSWERLLDTQTRLPMKENQVKNTGREQRN